MDKVIFIVLALAFALPAQAFTDGSGIKIIAQLTALLKTTNEQLQNTKDMLNVKKRLEDMETVKTVRETSRLADDLDDLFAEMERTIEHFDYDPKSSVSEIRYEIDNLKSRYREAKGADDKLDRLKGYARLLRSIETLSSLEMFHKAQMQKISQEGINEQDAIKQSAYTNSIRTQLLIERSRKAEEQEINQMKHATEEAIYLRRMGGVYGAIGQSNKGQ